MGKPKRKVGRDILVYELRRTYSFYHVYALLGNLSSDIMRIVIYRHLFPGRDSRFMMPAEKFDAVREPFDVLALVNAPGMRHASSRFCVICTPQPVPMHFSPYV